jgi:hypothetical protein
MPTTPGSPGSPLSFSTETEMINYLEANSPSKIIPNAITKEIQKGTSSEFIKQFGGTTGANIIKDINFNYANFNPFISGYNYFYMQPGTWVNYFEKHNLKNYNNNDSSNLITAVGTQTLKTSAHNMGKYVFNSDLPTLLMESDVISGRLRSINYATKLTMSGEFSINFHDTNKLDLTTYNSTHIKFMESLRRGDIDLLPEDKVERPTDYFIKMPYYDAFWILVFKPFSTIPVAIFKIMGIYPNNLPFQQIVGDRGNPTLGIFSQTFKCNDIIFDFIGDNGDATPISYDSSGTRTSIYQTLLQEFNTVYKNNLPK